MFERLDRAKIRTNVYIFFCAKIILFPKTAFLDFNPLFTALHISSRSHSITQSYRRFNSSLERSESIALMNPQAFFYRWDTSWWRKFLLMSFSQGMNILCWIAQPSLLVLSKKFCIHTPFQNSHDHFNKQYNFCPSQMLNSLTLQHIFHKNLTLTGETKNKVINFFNFSKKLESSPFKLCHKILTTLMIIIKGYNLIRTSPHTQKQQNMDKNSMLNLIKIVPWSQPLHNLTKFNNSIIGTNSSYQIIEVDTKDSSIDKITQIEYRNHQPDICDAKFLNTQFGKGYYFCHKDRVEVFKGDIISETNKKAEFVRGIDGYQKAIIFSKYHKVHEKFSINLQLPEQEKKIIQLFDQPLQKIHITRDKQTDKIVYTEGDHRVSLIPLQKNNKMMHFPHTKSFVFDDNYVFMMKGPKSQKNGHNYTGKSNYYDPSNHQVRIEAVTPESLFQYGRSSSCSLDFFLPKFPNKIQSFRNDIIVSYNDSLEIYDVRKIVSSYARQQHPGIKDFHYEPNLCKIYLSTSHGLRIYEHK